MSNVPHRLMYLNIWFLIAGVVSWDLQEVKSCMSLRAGFGNFYSDSATYVELASCPCYYVCCYVFPAVTDFISLEIGQNKSFSSCLLQFMVFYDSTRKVTNIACFLIPYSRSYLSIMLQILSDCSQFLNLVRLSRKTNHNASTKKILNSFWKFPPKALSRLFQDDILILIRLIIQAFLDPQIAFAVLEDTFRNETTTLIH